MPSPTAPDEFDIDDAMVLVLLLLLIIAFYQLGPARFYDAVMPCWPR